MEAKTVIAAIWLIGFMARTIPVSCYNIRSLKSKKFSTWMPWNCNPSRTIENIESDIVCFSMCASEQSCRGAFRNGSTCAMFSVNGIELVKTGDASHAVGFVRLDTLVFQIKDELNYAAAQSICSSFDGVLASRADIQRLYEEGISKCACGWIIEGYGVYPMTYSDSSCESTIGLIECNGISKQRAWCKFLPQS